MLIKAHHSRLRSFTRGYVLATTTKKDLALKISQETGCKKNLGSKMVDVVFEAMRESLIDGRRIEIRGFGVFQVKETRPKPAARNPRTGQIIYVPARRKTHFRPGKLLKEELHKPIDDQPAPPQNVGYQPPPPSPNHSTPPQT